MMPMVLRISPRYRAVRRTVLAIALAGTAWSPAATLPAGFAETKIAEGLNPTTMNFAPDGRLFLCEKHGLLRVIVDQTLVPEPVLDLSGKIDAWNERGLLGVCFDPDFRKNGWIYVYYTLNEDPKDKSHSSSHNRVSRFTLKGNIADPKSEKVLLDLNKLSKTGWHNGGGMDFGKDGKLYIGTGENANAAYAQDGSNLLGKLLRINKDGSIPNDNPYYDEFKGENRAIVALGLRNAFNVAVQPQTGLLYLSMVGANYEEIDHYNTAAAPVALNYGWPEIDGPRRKQKEPAGYQEPAHAYDHGDATALCGGNFYDPSAPGADSFPAEYKGRFFFSDYKGWIRSIDPAKPEKSEPFASKINRPIDVDVAPDGALWYIERAGIPGGSDEANSESKNGSLWRVHWTGGGQAVKLAVIQQPVDALLGGSIGTVKVAIQDGEGKTLSSSSDTVALSLGGGEPIAKVAAVKGIATFPSLRVSPIGEGLVLRASSGTLADARSEPFVIANQLAEPTITPAEGDFTGPIWVTLSSPVPNARITYTLDGTDPAVGTANYVEPFRIDSTRTIRAMAWRQGSKDSAVASAKVSVIGKTPYGMDIRPAVKGLRIPASEAEGLPATLSALGILSDGKLTPKPGVVPYSLNAPAWADGAVTKHWVILPESARIGFSTEGEFAWPGGTVFVQHFEIGANHRRLETRLLVLDATGSFGYGASYRWRADQSDADLVDAGGAEEVLKVAAADGKMQEQTWTYPARALCFLCHTQNAGFVLGPKARQLNGDHVYADGRTDNQLRTWNYLQMFGAGFSEKSIGGYAKICRVDDAAASLESRVRSYLDANCAHCHRPGGTGAQWDARFDTPLEKQNLFSGDLRDTMGISGAKIVAPGDSARSMMHVRMSSTTLGQQMPPLTRNVVDKVAVETLEKWIKELSAKAGE